MEPVPLTDPSQPGEPNRPQRPSQVRQSAESGQPATSGQPGQTIASGHPTQSEGKAATAESVQSDKSEISGVGDAASAGDAAGPGGAGSAARSEVPLGTVDGEPEELGEMPRLKRGQERSPRDMALSLAVLIVPIALLLIFYRVFLNGDAPVTIDPSSTIQEARRAAVFTVVAPQGLGDDWHTSSAIFQRQAAGATLRLGYVDPDKDPVQLVESSIPPATLLRAELGDSAKALGNFRTPAGVWRVYDGRPGEKALVLAADPTRTIIVVGKTDMKNLETLARSLT